MDEKPEITEAFIENMVDRVISELGRKLEALDVSLDYIAAAILDGDPIGIASRQSQRGRMANVPSKPPQIEPRSE
jgi:hypothetical protein|tara:strand:- start:1069 stop:1293 length:225 start_codon:yes stop_codon:yes gene_type:complete